MEAVTALDPVEVLTLIRGLPETSRFAARQQGEPAGRGWGRSDYLAFDARNAAEATRALLAGALQGKKALPFQQWEHYPGADAAVRQRHSAKLDRLAKMAGASF